MKKINKDKNYTTQYNKIFILLWTYDYTKDNNNFNNPNTNNFNNDTNNNYNRANNNDFNDFYWMLKSNPVDAQKLLYDFYVEIKKRDAQKTKLYWNLIQLTIVVILLKIITKIFKIPIKNII